MNKQNTTDNKRLVKCTKCDEMFPNLSKMMLHKLDFHGLLDARAVFGERDGDSVE